MDNNTNSQTSAVQDHSQYEQQSDQSHQITPVDAQTQEAQQFTQPENDVFGIASLVLPLIGLWVVGVIVGYVGIRRARRLGYSPTLSRIGFWVSIILFACWTLIVSLAYLYIGH